MDQISPCITDFIHDRESLIYLIKQNDGTFIKEQPKVGGWYAGFLIRTDHHTDEEYSSTGAIAQYVGDGQFFDEDDEDPTDMGYYDYIVYQFSSSL